MDRPNSALAGTTNSATSNSNGLLSLTLRVGVVVSATLIGLGLLLFLFTGKGGYAEDSPTPPRANADAYVAFPSGSEALLSQGAYFPTNPSQIWQGVLEFKPFALIMLGLVLLIITPVLNVALALVGFLRMRDRAFSLISLFVLFVMLLSFFLGKAGG